MNSFKLFLSIFLLLSLLFSFGFFVFGQEGYGPGGSDSEAGGEQPSSPCPKAGQDQSFSVYCQQVDEVGENTGFYYCCHQSESCKFGECVVQEQGGSQEEECAGEECADDETGCSPGQDVCGGQCFDPKTNECVNGEIKEKCQNQLLCKSNIAGNDDWCCPVQNLCGFEDGACIEMPIIDDIGEENKIVTIKDIFNEFEVFFPELDEELPPNCNCSNTGLYILGDVADPTKDFLSSPIYIEGVGHVYRHDILTSSSYLHIKKMQEKYGECFFLMVVPKPEELDMLAEKYPKKFGEIVVRTHGNQTGTSLTSGDNLGSAACEGGNVLVSSCRVGQSEDFIENFCSNAGEGTSIIRSMTIITTSIYDLSCTNGSWGYQECVSDSEWTEMVPATFENSSLGDFYKHQTLGRILQDYLKQYLETLEKKKLSEER